MTTSESLIELINRKKESLRAINRPDEARRVEEEIAVLRAAVETEAWAYAVWMAYLADEATHELDEVLKRFSAWMFERDEEVSDDT